jgi:cobalt-zinc-cadmium efflux system outer membrane protein
MFFTKARARRALWRGLVLFLMATAAAAVEVVAEPQGELSLSMAVAAAQARNPELAANAYELSIADARTLQAGLRPNPQLALELENFAGSGVASGVDALETTLTLSRVIEMGRKRELRRDAAGYARELAGVDRQARQLDVLAEVTRRFVEVVLAQQHDALAQEAVQLAEQTLAAISARVDAARSPEAERSRARIALTRARIEQQQAGSALLGARRSLAATWSSRAAQFSRASADLYVMPPVESLEDWVQRMGASPDFLRFASESRLRDAEIRLARAQARQDLNAGLGVRHLQASGDVALVAGFSIGMPWSNSNQGAIREAELRREQSLASAQAAQLNAEATVYRIYQELTAVRWRTETLLQTAIPQAQGALEQTRYGYERGRFSYLELASAQQELIGLRAAAIDAAGDFHLLLSELERLTGRALATDPERNSQ